MRIVRNHHFFGGGENTCSFELLLCLLSIKLYLWLHILYIFLFDRWMRPLPHSFWQSKRQQVWIQKRPMSVVALLPLATLLEPPAAGLQLIWLMNSGRSLNNMAQFTCICVMKFSMKYKEDRFLLTIHTFTRSSAGKWEQRIISKPVVAVKMYVIV